MSETVDGQRSLLDELREKRTKVLDELSPAIQAREEARKAYLAKDEEFRAIKNPSEEQRTAFASEESAYDAAEGAYEAQTEALKRSAERLAKRIGEQQLEELRRSEAARASRFPAQPFGAQKEPLTYRKDNAGELSYYRDFALYSKPSLAGEFRHTDPEQARDRLLRHGKEMDVELPKRTQVRDERAQRAVENAEQEFRRDLTGQRRGLDESPFEIRTPAAPNRTQGQGGYFVPPLWLIDEFIPYLRQGRVASNLCRNLPMPPGTDSINIPKVATGTQTAIQTADSTAVQETWLTDTSVQANVKTVAGQQDVAIQLLDQSPGQIMDQVITEDLMADYNRLLDQQVVYGNGQNTATLNGGQVLGIYPSTNWAGTNVVTWTMTTGSPNETPSGQRFVQVLAAMASQASYSRYSLQNFQFLLHPRRWFWYASSLDSTGRPIVESPRGMGMNIAATQSNMVPAEGLAGNVPFGPNVYISGNVPTTDTTGGGTGQDIAIGAKWDDLWLFEGEPRTRVLEEVLSGTLQIRFQVYGYIAFLARYGQSIAIAEGSGFAQPTGLDASVTF